GARRGQRGRGRLGRRRVGRHGRWWLGRRGDWRRLRGWGSVGRLGRRRLLHARAAAAGRRGGGRGGLERSARADALTLTVSHRGPRRGRLGCRRLRGRGRLARRGRRGCRSLVGLDADLLVEPRQDLRWRAALPLRAALALGRDRGELPCQLGVELDEVDHLESLGQRLFGDDARAVRLGEQLAAALAGALAPAAAAGRPAFARRRALAGGARLGLRRLAPELGDHPGAGRDRASLAEVAEDLVEVRAAQGRRVADDDQETPRARERDVDALHELQEADLAPLVRADERDDDDVFLAALEGVDRVDLQLAARRALFAAQHPPQDGGLLGVGGDHADVHVLG